MSFVITDKKVLAIPTENLSPAVLNRLNELYRIITISVFEQEFLILPHKQSVLNVLNTLGVNTDGCDLFSNYYEPPKGAWWWQLETAKFLTSNNYAFVTSTPRTGKTLSTLMAIDFIQQQSPTKSSALIVAPLTVASGGEWEQSIRKFFPNKKYVVVHSNREVQIDIPADIYITNPDSVKILKDKLKAKVEKGLINLMVFDELTEFANTSSQRWKAASEVASKCKYRWGLTGTPGKPEKIYGQVKLINPDKVPKYFSRWRDMTEVKVSRFLWIPKHGHEEIIKEAMSPCIRFDKEQLMKVPIPEVRTVKVPLSEQQSKIMKELVYEFRAVIEGEEVNVLNASALAIKMLQVAGGAVRVDDEGESKIIDAEPKLTKLYELLKETPRKKVIFSSFVAINNMLVDKVKEWGFSCEKIDGEITGKQRARILEAFMNNKDPHILVCHPRTTAFGVELAAADMIICYGCPITGAFVYQQMFERISSSKQTATKTAVVHLSAGKQDAISFNALSNGVSIEKNIVKVFTQNLLEEEVGTVDSKPKKLTKTSKNHFDVEQSLNIRQTNSAYKPLVMKAGAGAISTRDFSKEAEKIAERMENYMVRKRLAEALEDIEQSLHTLNDDKHIEKVWEIQRLAEQKRLKTIAEMNNYLEIANSAISDWLKARQKNGTERFVGSNTALRERVKQGRTIVSSSNSFTQADNNLSADVKKYLDEVLQKGDETQKQKALTLLTQINEREEEERKWRKKVAEQVVIKQMNDFLESANRAINNRCFNEAKKYLDEVLQKGDEIQKQKVKTLFAEIDRKIKEDKKEKSTIIFTIVAIFLLYFILPPSYFLYAILGFAILLLL